MDTLYLDPETWDLTLNSQGDVAVASAPYATAQDVASECKLWLGEARYDKTKGIPYETGILGQLPPPAKLMTWYKEAAEGVPGVAESTVILQYGNRTLSGQIQCALEDGTEFELNF